MESAVMVKKRNRAYWLLIISSFILYITMTSAKNLYVAEKTTLYTLGTFGNLTDLAATMEYYFYTYAAAQLFMVLMMKRLNLKWYVTLCLGASAVITVLMSFTGNILQHYVLYTVNGFFQACLWGCQIKVFSLYLPKRLLPAANRVASAGPAVAGAVAYGIAAAFGDNWRAPFFMMGILLLAIVLLYFFSVTYVSRFPKEIETHHVVYADGSEADVSDEEENDFIHLKSRKRILWFYVISVLIGALVTSLYFALNNNLDVFLKEIGGLSNDAAKWLTVFAPLVAAVGPFITVYFCERHNNFITVGAVHFGAAMLVALLLLLLFELNVILSLILMILFLTIVNGGRSISLSIAALRMRQKIDSGVYTTLVNVAASIVAGLSPKLVAMILDNQLLSVADSWHWSLAMILAWSALTVVALLVILFGVKRLNKKDKKTEKIFQKS